jgi:hypothetical protein
MHFGSPTPVFYEILFVVFLTGALAAIGLNAAIAFALGFIASYVLFIGSVSGFKDSSAIAMAAGWGILVMMPTSAGLGVSAILGYFMHRRHKRKNEGTTK